MPSFPQSVVSVFWLTSCSVRTQPYKVENRDGEQKEAPRKQGEMVSNLLHHVDTHKSTGLGGIHLRL